MKKRLHYTVKDRTIKRHYSIGVSTNNTKTEKKC